MVLGAGEEALLELVAVAAADAQTGAGGEQDFGSALFGGFDAADAFKIDDGGAVNAAKRGGIEFGLDVSHAPAEKMSARATRAC